MNDDIWSGAAIKKSDDPVYVNVPSWEIRRMVNAQKEDSSAVKIISAVIAGILTLVCLYFSVCGPAMWHHKLVVCNGTACREYTDWKVRRRVNISSFQLYEIIWLIKSVNKKNL